MRVQHTPLFEKLRLRTGDARDTALNTITGPVVPEPFPAVLESDRTLAALQDQAITLLRRIFEIGEEMTRIELAATGAIVVLEFAVEGHRPLI